MALETTDTDSSWPFMVTVHTAQPVLACLGSQYAGWSLSTEDNGKKYSVLGSGPARAIGSSEKLFEELDYRDKADSAVLVLEADRPPPPALVEEVAKACKLKPDRLTFIYAPTSSLAGTVQIAARCLEVALHKSHELHFPLDHIVDGMATAPLPPPAPDFIAAMGRTNDAIIYGGRAQLFVSSGAKEAKGLADTLPSLKSKDYGKPFADIFAAVKGDFYAIDRMLFSPAKVTVTSLKIGRELRGGAHRQRHPLPLLRLTDMPTPGASDAAIVMFGDGRDWHGRSLTRAFKRAGDHAPARRRSTNAASRP